MEIIDEIGYGEIYNVWLDGEVSIRIAEVSEEKRNFILALRKAKQYNKVVIHDGEPVGAEYKTTVGDYNCLQKLKF